ncbi:hypothetical protein FQN50_006882 [Emmonsiellopsis sp. PD_5]|nr:hypothetical protein FQN50_006882 [Emmonsiellopsis sp. PD_5]
MYQDVLAHFRQSKDLPVESLNLYEASDAVAAQDCQYNFGSHGRHNFAKPVYTYGVDSLVAIKLHNWLTKRLRGDLSILELTGDVPMAEPSKKIAGQSRWVLSSVEGQ